jgi:bifunctional enzyme CysN/CysC
MAASGKSRASRKPAGDAKTLLRFLTCGSVDDGKSTLIGRLLHEAKAVFEDQLAAVAADSRRFGTQGEEIDLALLVDGLAAEREQGITIDVAWRYFSTARRKFIVADTPGHEQYTRNMATGASNADLAVILLDARKGVLTQTRRHTYIASLLGIREVALAVNKMDLVDWSQARFNEIVAEYREFANGLAGVGGAPLAIAAIPVSALKGDNIVSRSGAMTWYAGPTLLEHLESVSVDDDKAGAPFRMAVQWVNRPSADFRGFAGMVSAGSVRPGDRVRVLPAGRESAVSRIVWRDGDLGVAEAGRSITLMLADEIDIARGDLIAAASAPAEVADQFETAILWMAEEPMLPGRPYLMKIGAQTVRASVTTPKYRVNVDSFEHVAATKLELNEIGVCNVALDRNVGFDPYAANRDTGGFILIDRDSNATVGMGFIHFALRRSQNIHWQAVEVGREARASLKGQKPVVLWFTGLSGSGKSTIANILEKKLAAANRHTYLLDGDNVRHGLNKDLGFTDADRVENIRRVAEVAKLMSDAGLIALVSFISPFRAERRMARELMGQGEFVEIFIDAPLAVAESRDVKGLYAKARKGLIKNFTGIDSPYEPPESPEVHIDAAQGSAEAAADTILSFLRDGGFIRS